MIMKKHMSFLLSIFWRPQQGISVFRLEEPNAQSPRQLAAAQKKHGQKNSRGSRYVPTGAQCGFYESTTLFWCWHLGRRCCFLLSPEEKARCSTYGDKFPGPTPTPREKPGCESACVCGRNLANMLSRPGSGA